MENLINLLPILQKNRKIQESLYKMSNLGIALIDSDGKYLTMNNFFLMQLGYTLDEITQMSYRTITPPFLLDENNIGFNSLIQGECSDFHMAKKLYCKNGSSIYVHARGFRFHSEIGHRDKVLCFYIKDEYMKNHVISQYLKKSCCKIESSNELPNWENLIEYLNIIKKDNNYASEISGILVINGANGKIDIAQGSFIAKLGLTERSIESSFRINQIIEEETIKSACQRLNRKPNTIINDHKVNLYSSENRISYNSDLFLLLNNEGNPGNNKVLAFFKRKGPENEELLKMYENIELIKQLSTQIAEKLFSNKEVGNEGRQNLDITPFSLTSREKTVLRHISELKSVKEIAYSQNIAEVTVRKHLTKIYRKFGVYGKEELLLRVYNRNLID